MLYIEQYSDVPQSEAEDAAGKIKPGYKKWAYSWKKIIPDTPEVIAKEEKFPKAYDNLKALIAAMNTDPTKVKLEEAVAHLIQIEIIMGMR